jgi:hypothetical protein
LTIFIGCVFGARLGRVVRLAASVAESDSELRKFVLCAIQPVRQGWLELTGVEVCYGLWLLVSLAWIMGWALHLAIYGLHQGFKKPDVLKVPIVLCVPPSALLLTGFATRWAIKGFAPGKQVSEQRRRPNSES